MLLHALTRANFMKTEANTMRRIVFMCFTICVIYSASLSAQTKPYRGAEYRTRAAYTYGRFEVRTKSSYGSGMLTSFFTYHDEPPFTPSNWNEIDIELLGRYNNEVQFNTITPGRIDHVQRQPVKFTPHQAFHVYAVEWTPDYVAWMIDGYEVYRQTQSHVSTLTRAQKVMMNIWQPIYVDWVGSFNPAVLPLYGMYDWVKYYSYTPGVGDNFTLQWSDDFNQWDQSRWDRATHTFEGNNAQFIPENVAFQDGYLIICLTNAAPTGYNGGPVIDQDVDAPYLAWARAEPDRFQIFFSEELEQTAAETMGNYTVPGAVIQNATLLPGNKIVELRAAAINLSQSYVLVASNIKDRANPPHTAGLQFVQVSSGLQFPAQINLAGAAEDGYLADQTWDFYKEYGAIGGAQNTLPAGTVISGTNEPAIYQTELEGLTFYQARVPAGRYHLTLMMADSKYQSGGQRVFDVYAEGNLVFDNLDIVAEAGPGAALEKTAAGVEVTDGVLDLYFKRQTDLPVLSGLKIARAGATGVQLEQHVPEVYGLEVYPNPFNPAAIIADTLQQKGYLELVLFNLNGQRIQSLVQRFAPAGAHTHLFEPEALSAGVYFIGLYIEGKFVAVKRAVYLK